MQSLIFSSLHGIWGRDVIWVIRYLFCVLEGREMAITRGGRLNARIYIFFEWGGICMVATVQILRHRTRICICTGFQSPHTLLWKKKILGIVVVQCWAVLAAAVRVALHSMAPTKHSSLWHYLYLLLCILLNLHMYMTWGIGDCTVRREVFYINHYSSSQQSTSYLIVSTLPINLLFHHIYILYYKSWCLQKVYFFLWHTSENCKLSVIIVCCKHLLIGNLVIISSLLYPQERL